MYLDITGHSKLGESRGWAFGLAFGFLVWVSGWTRGFWCRNGIGLLGLGTGFWSGFRVGLWVGLLGWASSWLSSRALSRAFSWLSSRAFRWALLGLPF